MTEGFLERTAPRRWHHYARRQTSTVAACAEKAFVPNRRTPQVRQKSKNRHPTGYWQNITTVENELRQFWSTLGVTISRDDDEPPPIPNEALLNHFERNDLRYVVVSHGGRKPLSEKLGGARIMPGRWTVAVNKSPELQTLLKNATHGLSPHVPPLSPQQKKQQKQVNKKVSSFRNRVRWNHSPARKPKGYWTIEMVLKEL